MAFCVHAASTHISEWCTDELCDIVFVTHSRLIKLHLRHESVVSRHYLWFYLLSRLLLIEKKARNSSFSSSLWINRQQVPEKKELFLSLCLGFFFSLPFLFLLFFLWSSAQSPVEGAQMHENAAFIPLATVISLSFISSSLHSSEIGMHLGLFSFNIFIKGNHFPTYFVKVGKSYCLDFF